MWFKAKNEIRLQTHVAVHQKKCDLCKIVFKTVGLLRRHMNTDHSDTNENTAPPSSTASEYPMKCTLCDFKAASNIQLKKHMKVRHEDKERTNLECRFWLRGYCARGDECNFTHKTVTVCRYEMQCLYWPNCKFFHPEAKPCRFQEFF